jgi:membrane fusion protein, heavy metal efflux system
MNRFTATCAASATLAATLGLLLSVAVDLHASPGAHGPNGEHLGGPASNRGTAGLSRLPDGSVNVPMAAQRRMAVRTQFSKAVDAAASVELLGRVVNDPNAGGLVQPMSSGRIEAGPDGLPTVGETVRKGQVLGYVRYNADPYARANQQVQLAQLRSNLALARQRVARLESLADTVPRKEIEAARAELASLSTATGSVGAALDGREPLLAPVSGIIAQANAISGQVVDARDLLFQIVDPTRLQVEATTADPALAARIEGASLIGVEQAELNLIGGGGSLRDGLIPIRFRVTLADKAAKGVALALAVGQPVTVVARLRERTRGAVLPREAVVRNAANEPIVWIKSGAERYLPQPVQAQVLDARNVVVTQGLGDENRVVVQGAALIAQIR